MQSTPCNERSLCHNRTTRSPSTCSSALAASPSSSEPGKVTTPHSSIAASVADLESVVFDHAVGQELAAHVVQATAGALGVALEPQLDVLSEPHVVRLAKTERVQDRKSTRLNSSHS